MKQKLKNDRFTMIQFVVCSKKKMLPTFLFNKSKMADKVFKDIFIVTVISCFQLRRKVRKCIFLLVSLDEAFPFVHFTSTISNEKRTRDNAKSPFKQMLKWILHGANALLTFHTSSHPISTDQLQANTKAKKQT